MENYSSSWEQTVMKMAVEMAAVSMEKPSRDAVRQGAERDSVPRILASRWRGSGGFAYRGFFVGVLGASSSLATTSSELENLRSSYQELETKLMEAEQKREQAEKQLAEKNSELIKEKGEFLLKRNADIETIKRQQKELNGLRKYMETAEHHWDLLNEYILEPLGYPEKRRNLFPRDDLLQLAGDDCKDLISASRKICHNLSIKRSRTCEVRKLVKKMDVLPELVTDLQASSARGAAAMTLIMCLAHNSELDLDRVTTGVPPEADVGALLDAVSGYDTRIARRIRHEEFYDKVVLPADEPLEAELQKEHDAEARPAESGTQFTWTSSKDATQDQPKERCNLGRGGREQ
ncbi:hypothetical protein QYE76_056448 [Lolium multiflorum]|uniref:Uncharacterized protein n=1 Tax=Lolium multiflorum TaxID=4521 RepID=A0AAD8WMU6_LOLMU|nr:hypothetical protein QYE76_056448 [Lolium multiflorum]